MVRKKTSLLASLVLAVKLCINIFNSLINNSFYVCACNPQLGGILPAKFLNSERRASYGLLSGGPNDIQLAGFFKLDEEEMDFINKQRGRANHQAGVL